MYVVFGHFCYATVGLIFKRVKKLVLELLLYRATFAQKFRILRKLLSLTKMYLENIMFIEQEKFNDLLYVV